MQEMTVYNRDIFVFVDENGNDRRDLLCRYGLRGKPARSQKVLVRRKRVSAIGALLPNTAVHDRPCKNPTGIVSVTTAT